MYAHDLKATLDWGASMKTQLFSLGLLYGIALNTSATEFQIQRNTIQYPSDSALHAQSLAVACDRTAAVYQVRMPGHADYMVFHDLVSDQITEIAQAEVTPNPGGSHLLRNFSVSVPFITCNQVTMQSGHTGSQLASSLFGMSWDLEDQVLTYEMNTGTWNVHGIGQWSSRLPVGSTEDVHCIRTGTNGGGIRNIRCGTGDPSTWSIVIDRNTTIPGGTGPYSDNFANCATNFCPGLSTKNHSDRSVAVLYHGSGNQTGIVMQRIDDPANASISIANQSSPVSGSPFLRFQGPGIAGTSGSEVLGFFGDHQDGSRSLQLANANGIVHEVIRTGDTLDGQVVNALSGGPFLTPVLNDSGLIAGFAHIGSGPRRAIVYNPLTDELEDITDQLTGGRSYTDVESSAGAQDGESISFIVHYGPQDQEIVTITPEAGGCSDEELQAALAALAAANAEINSLEMQVAGLDTQVSDQQTQIDDLEMTVTDLETENADLLLLADDFMDQIDDLEQTIGNLQQDLVKTQANLDAAINHLVKPADNATFAAFVRQVAVDELAGSDASPKDQDKAAKHIGKGDKQMDKGKFKNAIEEYLKAIKKLRK